MPRLGFQHQCAKLPNYQYALLLDHVSKTPGTFGGSNGLVTCVARGGSEHGGVSGSSGPFRRSTVTHPRLPSRTLEVGNTDSMTAQSRR